MYRVDLATTPSDPGSDPLLACDEGTWLYGTLDDAEAEAAAIDARLRRLGRTGWVIATGPTIDVTPLQRARLISRHIHSATRNRADLTAARDECVVQAHEEGATDTEIAEAAGVDRSRVTRIIRDRVGWRGQGRRKGAGRGDEGRGDE